ncbi:cysteine desulfurase family protein [Fusibacter ferrireducens]|uniref:cysteine desulfurase n=1 Tax=Fusibacter ferrireducens TaxID=2785058 RepID=A0ABR9ZSW5_9FIRM|nr:cysteine desulfurase family protein [Fusibacter ferrireducens]MBF4693565.1 cysteine desulfurase [Fusibacter ferrireducens]
MKKRIFLDYAATTPVRAEVADVIIGAYRDIETVWHEIQVAKTKIATLMGCDDNDICITNCGSESNNVLIKTIVRSLPQDKNHIITSEIEHPSVLNVFKQLERDGFKVSYLKVDANGVINLDAFYRCVNEKTGFVSTMFYNNEIGTRQPIEIMGSYLRARQIFFHVDGVQAVYNESFKVSELPIDAMSFSAHKLYGPKGMGGLYVAPKAESIKRDLIACLPYSTRSKAFVFSENTPYLIGFGSACALAFEDRETHIKHLRTLKQYLIQAIENLNADIQINAMNSDNHPGIVNFMLPKMDADSAMINLDMMGFAVSTGSACSSGAISASHVLMAIGLKEKEAKRCLRISLGHFTTEEDIDEFISALRVLV